MRELFSHQGTTFIDGPSRVSKESAFPLMRESQVVIDVHDITEAERRQILYNHIKLGIQPRSFRSAIKPYLDYVASVTHALPPKICSTPRQSDLQLAAWMSRGRV